MVQVEVSQKAGSNYGNKTTDLVNNAVTKTWNAKCKTANARGSSWYSKPDPSIKNELIKNGCPQEIADKICKEFGDTNGHLSYQALGGIGKTQVNELIHGPKKTAQNTTPAPKEPTDTDTVRLSPEATTQPPRPGTRGPDEVSSGGETPGTYKPSYEPTGTNRKEDGYDNSYEPYSPHRYKSTNTNWLHELLVKYGFTTRGTGR